VLYIYEDPTSELHVPSFVWPVISGRSFLEMEVGCVMCVLGSACLVRNLERLHSFLGKDFIYV